MISFENYFSIEKKIMEFCNSNEAQKHPLVLLTMHPDKALSLSRYAEHELKATNLFWYLDIIGDTFMTEENGILRHSDEVIKYEHVANTLRGNEKLLSVLDGDGMWTNRINKIRKWIALFEYSHIPTICTLSMPTLRNEDANLQLSQLFEAHHVKMIIVQEPTFEQWGELVDKLLESNPKSPLLEIREWLNFGYRFAKDYNNVSSTLCEDWLQVASLIEQHSREEYFEDASLCDAYYDHIIDRLRGHIFGLAPQLKKRIREKDLSFIKDYFYRMNKLRKRVV